MKNRKKLEQVWKPKPRPRVSATACQRGHFHPSTTKVGHLEEQLTGGKQLPSTTAEQTGTLTKLHLISLRSQKVETSCTVGNRPHTKPTDSAKIPETLNEPDAAQKVLPTRARRVAAPLNLVQREDLGWKERTV